MIREMAVETHLLYFTDFLWLPVTLVADVISTARSEGAEPQPSADSELRKAPTQMLADGRLPNGAAETMEREREQIRGF